MNPRMLKPLAEGYKKVLEERNFFCHLQGLYINEAVSVALANAFRDKGKKPVIYSKEPYNIFRSKEEENLTEEEIQQERENLVLRLKIMENNFNRSKK